MGTEVTEGDRQGAAPRTPTVRITGLEKDDYSQECLLESGGDVGGDEGAKCGGDSGTRVVLPSCTRAVHGPRGADRAEITPLGDFSSVHFGFSLTVYSNAAPRPSSSLAIAPALSCPLHDSYSSTPPLPSTPAIYGVYRTPSFLMPPLLTIVQSQ